MNTSFLWPRIKYLHKNVICIYLFFFFFRIFICICLLISNAIIKCPNKLLSLLFVLYAENPQNPLTMRASTMVKLPPAGMHLYKLNTGQQKQEKKGNQRTNNKHVLIFDDSSFLFLFAFLVIHVVFIPCNPVHWLSKGLNRFTLCACFRFAIPDSLFYIYY